MRTYLILKEKVAQFNQDKEIQAILKEVNADDRAMGEISRKYTHEKMKTLKEFDFDRKVLSAKGLRYEKLDQLTNELLLGVR